MTCPLLGHKPSIINTRFVFCFWSHTAWTSKQLQFLTRVSFLDLCVSVTQGLPPAISLFLSLIAQRVQINRFNRINLNVFFFYIHQSKFFFCTKRYFQRRFFLSIMGAFYLSFSSIIFFFSLSCNCTSKTFFSGNSSKGVVSASCPGFVYRQITSHSEWNMKCISRVTNQLFLKAGCCIFYYQSAVSSVWLCQFSYCLFFPSLSFSFVPFFYFHFSHDFACSFVVDFSFACDYACVYFNRWFFFHFFLSLSLLLVWLCLFSYPPPCSLLVRDPGRYSILTDFTAGK